VLIAYAVVAFLFGAVLGSFLSVVAHRVPRGEGFVTGRSMCPNCGAQIAAYDNIPIVSWLVLRGRCRSCGERISARYPLVELGTGVAFAAAVVVHEESTDGLATGPDWAGLAAAFVFIAVLATITLADLDLRVIPNKVLIAGAILGLPLVLIADPDSAAQRGIAFAAAGGVLLLIALAYPRGMGMGDVKLAALMGVFLGRAAAPGLLMGFLAGTIVGVALIAKRGAAARKQAVPFGPFLALGGLIALFVGNAIVEWYLDEFFPDG
jgi:leader peptidase (prepilin peptidase) / N-methyltransferase